jgi:hypothetical protein
MKKFFAIILVFVLAPAASATISFVPNAVTVGPGGSFTIQVSSDVDSAAWSGYVGNSPSTVAALTTMWALPAAGDDAYVIPSPGGWSGYYGLFAADNTPPPDSIQAGIQFEGTVQIYGMGLYTIYLYAADWSTLLDTFTFGGLEPPVPAIDLSQSQFEFFVWPPGANPDDQVLEISNSGDGTLYWEITCQDCNWLDVNPTSGSSIGEADQVTLSVDGNDLPFGLYSCELTVSDPCASNNPQTVQVDLFVECMPLDATTAIFASPPLLDTPEENGSTTYAEWVAAGRPECWCYQAHCRGNADGITNGSSKAGYYLVGPDDFHAVVYAWDTTATPKYWVKEPPFGPGIATRSYYHPVLGSIAAICGNLNRMRDGSSKAGYYYVGPNDLNRLMAAWDMTATPNYWTKEPPFGPGIPTNDCGGSLIGP